MLLQLLILEIGNSNYSWNWITVNEFLLYLLKVWMLCVVFCVIGCGVCSVVPPSAWCVGGRILPCVTCIYRSWSSRYRLLNDSEKIKPIFFPDNCCSYFYFIAFHRCSPAVMSWSNSVSSTGNSCNVWCIPVWTAMQIFKPCYDMLFQWRFVTVVCCTCGELLPLCEKSMLREDSEMWEHSLGVTAAVIAYRLWRI